MVKTNWKDLKDHQLERLTLNLLVNGGGPHRWKDSAGEFDGDLLF